MESKIKSVYELFSDYTMEEVNEGISSLSEEERLLIKLRYGDDLSNPVISDNWNTEMKNKYYGRLVPKMRRLLLKRRMDWKNTDDDIDKIISDMIKIDMNGDSLDLLQLLCEGTSNKEICERLNISTKRLYQELLKLKKYGINYSRKYYSNGVIKYKGISSLKEMDILEDDQNKTIITDVSEQRIKMLVISDLHFGNNLERLDLINRAYEYCIKNGINIILCGGDLIDGSFTGGEQKISDLYKQVEYFLNNYPSDKNILTFGVAGDHDVSTLFNDALDIRKICDNYRHDIIIGGYGNMGINIKNDLILLHHRIKNVKLSNEGSIALLGHTHSYSVELINDRLNISIPTLSEIAEQMPTALELNLYFNKGYIVSSVVKQIYFSNEDIVLGEIKVDFEKKKKLGDGEVKNTEIFREEIDEGKSLVRVNQPLSQIDKFNMRYGMNKD